jgi:4-carboxymuconolactone decarboxylase
MRLSSPRIAPADLSALTEAQRAVLEPLMGRRPAGGVGPVLNIFRTLAQAPEALSAFLAWGSYILSKKNALPPREREIVILRIGFLCRSGYEWTQHVEIGLRCGLTEDEVARIKLGPTAPDWSPADRALLQATDELHHDHFISTPSWTALRSHFSEKACMDTVLTAGQYTQVSMILNSFGVQLDEGQTLDADLKGF